MKSFPFAQAGFRVGADGIDKSSDRGVGINDLPFIVDDQQRIGDVVKEFAVYVALVEEVLLEFVACVRVPAAALFFRAGDAAGGL